MRTAATQIRSFALLFTAALATAGCNIGGSLPVSTPAPQSATPVAATKADAMAKEIHDAVNAERITRGLPALSWNPQLASVAASWDQTMFQTGQFKHRDLNQLFNDPAFDHYGGLGENIYKGSGASFSSGSIHMAWMRSDGHRKNVLSPSFDSIGIAILCAPDGSTWATQNFGREMGSPLPALGTSGMPALNPIVTPSELGTGC